MSVNVSPACAPGLPSTRRRAAGFLLGCALLVGAASFSQSASAQRAAATLSVAVPEAAGMSGDALKRITQSFNAEIDAGRLPGAVFAIARHGQLIYFEALGFQDKPAGVPMRKDTIFRWYSMTKPLVSVAAMMLVEEGRLQLTDPVAKHLPAFATMQVAQARNADGKTDYEIVPAARPITVHDLLRHTAGLAYGEVTPNQAVKKAYENAGLYKPNVIDFDVRDLSPTEFTERLAKQPLSAQPGTQWQYSLASDLLGRIVEVISGKRLGEFLNERLFKPLGMADAAFWVPPQKLSRLAQPLPRPSGGAFISGQIDVSHEPANDSGGAGAVGTALDYLRFAQMMLNGGSYDSHRYLSRPTVELMTSDHVGERPSVPATPPELLLGTQGYGFGLGFLVRTGAGLAAVPGGAGEAMWGGYGGTYFWIDPKEQLSAVMMTQGPQSSRQFYRKMFKALVYQAIAD